MSVLYPCLLQSVSDTPTAPTEKVYSIQTIYSSAVKIGKTYRFFYPGISFDRDIVISSIIFITDETYLTKAKKDAIHAVYLTINGMVHNDVSFQKQTSIGKEVFPCHISLSRQSIFSLISYSDIGHANIILNFSYA